MSVTVHKVSTIVTQRGVPMTVRLVCEGDRYGLRDCLTHDDPRPMIEFYDARYDHHAGRGQFITRYYLATLWEHPVHADLMLEGSEPLWTVDAAALQHVLNWAVYCQLAEAQAAIADTFAGAA
jgi:hypothetical protein